jgi:hypothetical protein
LQRQLALDLDLDMALETQLDPVSDAPLAAVVTSAQQLP